jgi:hypothetical protein
LAVPAGAAASVVPVWEAVFSAVDGVDVLDEHADNSSNNRVNAAKKVDLDEHFNMVITPLFVY